MFMCLVKLKTHELSHRGLPTLERHIEKKFSIDPPIDGPMDDHLPTLSKGTSKKKISINPPIDGPMDHPFPYLINLNGLLIDFL